MAEDGLITIQSDHDFLTTLERLLSALKEKVAFTGSFAASTMPQVRRASVSRFGP